MMRGKYNSCDQQTVDLQHLLTTTLNAVLSSVDLAFAVPTSSKSLGNDSMT